MNSQQTVHCTATTMQAPTVGVAHGAWRVLCLPIIGPLVTGRLVQLYDDAALAPDVLRLPAHTVLVERRSTASRIERESRYLWAHVQRAWEDCYRALAVTVR